MTHGLRYVKSTLRGEKEPTSLNHRKRMVELPLAMLNLPEGCQKPELWHAIYARLCALAEVTEFVAKQWRGSWRGTELCSNTENCLASL
jgi:hypothetical protein